MDLAVKTALWKAKMGNDFSDLADYVRNGQKFLLDDKEAREFIADVLTGKRKNKVGRQPYSVFHPNHEKYSKICFWFAYFRALGFPRWEASGTKDTALSLTAKKMHVSGSIKKTDPIRHALKVTYCREGDFRKGAEHGYMSQYFIDQGVLDLEGAVSSCFAFYSASDEEEVPKYFFSSEFYDKCDLIVNELLDGKEGII